MQQEANQDAGVGDIRRPPEKLVSRELNWLPGRKEVVVNEQEVAHVNGKVELAERDKGSVGHEASDDHVLQEAALIEGSDGEAGSDERSICCSVYQLFHSRDVCPEQPRVWHVPGDPEAGDGGQREESFCQPRLRLLAVEKQCHSQHAHEIGRDVVHGRDVQTDVVPLVFEVIVLRLEEGRKPVDI